MRPVCRKAVIVDHFVGIANREIHRINFSTDFGWQRLGSDDVAASRKGQTGKMLGFQRVIGIAGKDHGVRFNITIMRLQHGAGNRVECW